MRLIKLLAFALGLMLLGGCTPKPSQPQTVELVYFYDSPCASCDEEENFRALLEEKTKDLQAYRPFTLRSVNTFQAGYEERDKLALEKGVEHPQAYNTMLLIGNNLLTGDAIAPNLRQFYWQAVGLGTSSQVVEYYFRQDCPDCQSIADQMDAYLSALKKSVVRLDTADPQTKRDFRALMEAQQVPQERYQIPYLIEDGVHYSGAEEISDHILKSP